MRNAWFPVGVAQCTDDALSLQELWHIHLQNLLQLKLTLGRINAHKSPVAHKGRERWKKYLGLHYHSIEHGTAEFRILLPPCVEDQLTSGSPMRRNNSLERQQHVDVGCTRESVCALLIL